MVSRPGGHGGGVPMPRPVLLGGLDEPLNLSLGEIFAAAEVRARSKALFLPDVELSVVDARRKWGGP